MANWCLNTILISGPREDISVLYKSLEEYKDEIKSKEKEPGTNPFNIGALIKSKFSDKLPEFTEDDYALSYNNFIEDYSYLEGAYNDKAYLAIRSESPLVSRMYALVKLIEVGFPKCIINYTLRKSDESRFYFPGWFYSNRFKSNFCASDEYMYRILINDYADIIKDNNIVIPALIDPGKDQICKLVKSLVEYDEDLCVYPYSIGPEYDDKKVENLNI